MSKWAVLFVLSGSFLYTPKNVIFPDSPLYSEEEIKDVLDDYELLFFSSKKEALQVFSISIWKTYMTMKSSFIMFNNEKYHLCKDKDYFEIVEIKEK